MMVFLLHIQMSSSKMYTQDIFEQEEASVRFLSLSLSIYIYIHTYISIYLCVCIYTCLNEEQQQ